MYPWLWNRIDYNKVPVPHNHNDRDFACILLGLFAAAIPFIFIWFLFDASPMDVVVEIFSTIILISKGG